VGKGFRNKYWNRIELLKKWFGIEPEFVFIFYNEKNVYLRPTVYNMWKKSRVQSKNIAVC